MKKIFTFFLLFLLIPVVKAEEPKYSVKTKLYISRDSTMTYELNLSLNNEFMFKYDVDVEDIFNQNTYKISLDDKGYTVSTQTSNIGAGLHITKSFPDLKLISQSKATTIDLTRIDSETFSDKIFFQKKSGLFYTKYIGNFSFDYSNITGTEDITTEDLKNLLDLTFEVNLPVEALKYNATVINDDKNDLLWNLDPGKDNDVSFEFKQVNTTNLILLLIIGTIIVILLIIFIVKKASGKMDVYKEMKPKKEKKKKEKKKKVNKNVFNNGMSFEETNEEPIQTIQEQTVSLMASNTETNQKIDLMASQSPITNQSINTVSNEQQQPIQPQQPISQPEQNIFSQQPINQPQQENLYNQQSGQSIFNQQPINQPQQPQQDYTSVFNQTFDEDKK